MPGHVHAYTDAYGNLSHMMTLNLPHQDLAIVAWSWWKPAPASACR